MDSRKRDETDYKELLAKRVRSCSYHVNDEEAKAELKSKVFQKYQELLRKKEDEEFVPVRPKTHKITPLHKNALFTKEFLPFEFRGKAFEYFKIWIVNVLLTLFTLGIYSAWAKVRSNRYLYANTFLNGANFEYNANPKNILYGRVIVVGFYALFILFDKLYIKELALAIFSLFLLLLPWLINRAIAFKLKSTSYRNIKFSYQGRVRSFYYLGFLFILPLLLIIFLSVAAPNLARLFPILNFYLDALPIGIFIIMFLSIFIYYPLLYREYKRVVINNSYYGKQAFSFDAKAGETIILFLKIAFIMLFVILFLAFVSVELGKSFSFDLKNIDLHNSLHIIGIYLLVMGLYLVIISFFKGLSDGYLSNFVRNNTRLGDGEFQGSINPLKLAFISSTNALLLFFSLGLLYPYTKLRYLEYKIENSYFACEDYDKFLASKNENLSTLGEESVDFFDIDVGI